MMHPARAASFQGGVNLSGLEVNAARLPGIVGFDFIVPSDTELAYYKGKGLNLVRLPILWERLQPGVIGSQSPPVLNGTYVGYIRQVLADANSRGIGVIVDLHDYGGYGGHKIGGGYLTATEFKTVWQKLSVALAGSKGLAGYDIMNEPSNMPNPDVWPAAAQLAVNGIRNADGKTTLYVEGDDWASAGTWQQNNGSLHINDPANNLVYEAHVYGDQDNSGTHFIWAEVAAAGVTVQTIAQRVTPFAHWCQNKGVTCMIGEIGVGNDDPNWNTELYNGIQAMKQGALTQFTYWAGGPWWGSYPMSLEPRNGQDAKQMSVVDAY